MKQDTVFISQSGENRYLLLLLIVNTLEALGIVQTEATQIHSQFRK